MLLAHIPLLSQVLAFAYPIVLGCWLTFLSSPFCLCLPYLAWLLAHVDIAKVGKLKLLWQLCDLNCNCCNCCIHCAIFRGWGMLAWQRSGTRILPPNLPHYLPHWLDSLRIVGYDLRSTHSHRFTHIPKLRALLGFGFHKHSAQNKQVNWCHLLNLVSSTFETMVIEI